MKRMIYIALALALALALPFTANANDVPKVTSKPAPQKAAPQDTPVDFIVREIKSEATVVEMDKQNRTAVIRTPMGKLVTILVPTKFHNFDHVKVGDELVMLYQIATALEIGPASKSGIRERVESSSVQSAKPGALPGVDITRKVEILANISEIDRNTNTMTLRGATRTVTVAVPSDVKIEKLKVGDEVRAVIVDAMLIDMQNRPS